MSIYNDDIPSVSVFSSYAMWALNNEWYFSQAQCAGTYWDHSNWSSGRFISFSCMRYAVCTVSVCFCAYDERHSTLIKYNRETSKYGWHCPFCRMQLRLTGWNDNYSMNGVETKNNVIYICVIRFMTIHSVMKWWKFGHLWRSRSIK